MIRLLPLLALLAGCISVPTEAHVAWKTTGAPAMADPDLGATIVFDGNAGGDRTWVAGVDGSTVIDVYSNRICASLQHRTIEVGEQFGHETMDWAYEARSAEQCVDAEPNDHDVYALMFELAYAAP